MPMPNPFNLIVFNYSKIGFVFVPNISASRCECRRHHLTLYMHINICIRKTDGVRLNHFVSYSIIIFLSCEWCPEETALHHPDEE